MTTKYNLFSNVINNEDNDITNSFQNFAQLIVGRMQLLNEQALTSAVSIISKYLNIDEITQRNFLDQVCVPQQHSNSSILDELTKKMAEIDQLSNNGYEFNQDQVPSTFINIQPISLKAISPQCSLQQPPQLPSFLPTFNQHKVESINEQTYSFSSNSEKHPSNVSHKEANAKHSLIERNQFFREAVVHVFNVKEEMTDEQLCHVVQESKTCMWKQISEYSNGMMTTKQVSDYFWKTFVRACYKDQLTQQDKNYLTQVAHQNPRSSAAYLYDVVKPRFEGRNVFHDNVKMFLKQVLAHVNKQ
ncbi:Hypothetical_protein [Hexamita inflata]|uniref:Hypothetical_protein n=1 Tax=Hexamita inflata TaxID=28002 RepID=A0AA86NVP3_9EUKA|nr:Hypothetical protein HINF_LOCUS14374 [Hexamita inflata]